MNRLRGKGKQERLSVPMHSSGLRQDPAILNLKSYLRPEIGLPPLSRLLIAPVWSIQNESLPVRP